MGAARVKINGYMDEVITAYSGYANEAGFSILRDTRVFETLLVNPQQIVNGAGAFDRYVDSEAKILEEVAYRLRNRTSITGTINLYSERDFCPSCQHVISQFKEKFPNITVNPYKGKP